MNKFEKSNIELKEFKNPYSLQVSLVFYSLLIFYLISSVLSLYFYSFICFTIITLIFIFIILYSFKIIKLYNLIKIFAFIFLVYISLKSSLEIEEIYKISIFIVGLYLMYITIKEIPEYFLYLFFSIFFKYKPYIVKKHDFFTNEMDYIYALRKKKNRDKVIFFITPLTKNKSNMKHYKEIMNEYVKLAFFWYAYKYNRVKLRANIPIFAFIFSVIFFIYTLFILNSLDLYTIHSNKIINNFLENNFFKMSCIIVFSIVLYYSMLHYVNKFLDPNYYLELINSLFRSSKINFKQEVNNNQKVILYLDRTFLITIYDKNTDNFIILNRDKEFIRFVLDFYLDKEGRDYIINIFVSIFMVIYIAMFVQVLVDSETDKAIKESNIIKGIKNGNWEKP